MRAYIEIETDKPSPGTLLRVYQETVYIEADKPFPGTILADNPSPGTFGVHEDTDYKETDKPSPGPCL